MKSRVRASLLPLFTGGQNGVISKLISPSSAVHSNFDDDFSELGAVLEDGAPDTHLKSKSEKPQDDFSELGCSVHSNFDDDFSELGAVLGDGTADAHLKSISEKPQHDFSELGPLVGQCLSPPLKFKTKKTKYCFSEAGFLVRESAGTPLKLTTQKPECDSSSQLLSLAKSLKLKTEKFDCSENVLTIFFDKSARGQRASLSASSRSEITLEDEVLTPSSPAPQFKLGISSDSFKSDVAEENAVKLKSSKSDIQESMASLIELLLEPGSSAEQS